MRVFSGIQPTGTVHLGNYLGALVNWVKAQNEGKDCYFSIVNQHAITVPQDPATLKKNTLELTATLLAIGIDPEKSTLFLQSDVPGHAQLAWVLNCLAPMGHMERMIQFKEKSKKRPDAVNLGLFSYPVLQAADILLYRADIVPVGKDQAQHLELARTLAQKFNNAFGEYFPEPETLHGPTTKVVGLDGGAKMGKSSNNYIGITEPRDIIMKKLRGAATDPARVTRKDPGNPFICNVYKLHELFSQAEDLKYVEEGCSTAGIGCMDCKTLLFERIDAYIDPIRTKYNELISQPDTLRDVLAKGAQKANQEAKKTLLEVYERIGFVV